MEDGNEETAKKKEERKKRKKTDLFIGGGVPDMFFERRRPLTDLQHRHCQTQTRLDEFTGREEAIDLWEHLSGKNEAGKKKKKEGKER